MEQHIVWVIGRLTKNVGASQRSCDHYLEHRRQRDADILDALRGAGGSGTASHIVGIVYKGLSNDLTQAASETVLAHLYKLKTEGRVCERSDQNGAVWECK